MAEKLNSLSDESGEAQKDYREEMQSRMSRCAAFVRDSDTINEACSEAEEQGARFPDTPVGGSAQLPTAFRNRHLALAQRFYLESVRDYLARGGGSRGSYIVRDKEGRQLHEGLESEWRSKGDDKKLRSEIQHLSLEENRIVSRWEPCRPIPREDSWFEKVWAAFLQGEIFY